MKKTISVFAFFILLTSFSSIDKATSFQFDSPLENYVFICKGPYSKRYHYSSRCRGLSNCSTDTYKVTLNRARQMRRTLCGYED